MRAEGELMAVHVQFIFEAFTAQTFSFYFIQKHHYLSHFSLKTSIYPLPHTRT